jgi:hypothetical protein
MPTLAVDQVGQIVVKVLAVAGGAAVGGLLTGAMVGVTIRKLLRRKQPPATRTFFRLLGGVAGGLAAGVLLFTGLGGGGGWFGGAGPGDSKGDLTSTPAPHADVPTARAPETTNPPAPPPLRVVMLGGDLVRNGAAYRIEGERQPRTLADLKQVIEARTAAAPPAKALEILVYDNSVARGSVPVEDLDRWARQSGLTVTVVTKPGDIPP